MKTALSVTPSHAPLAPFIWQDCSPADAMSVATQLGYDGIELHLRNASDVDRVQVRREAAERGLEIPTIGTGLAAGLDGLSFASPDADVRRRAVERVKGHVELAAYLNASVIIGSLSGRVGNDSDRRVAMRSAALDCVAETCRFASTLGVSVILEPLNRYECDYLNTVQDVLDAIIDVDAPNLYVLGDTFHMNIEEVEIAASLRLAGNRLKHVHLADSNRQAAGHGHLDIGGVLRALSAMGYGGYLSFEVFPLPNPQQASEDAIREVRSLLSG